MSKATPPTRTYHALLDADGKYKQVVFAVPAGAKESQDAEAHEIARAHLERWINGDAWGPGDGERAGVSIAYTLANDDGPPISVRWYPDPAGEKSEEARIWHTKA